MAENSAIEWTDHTFNPWVGCTKVGPGCDHCYAERRMDTRLHRVRWGAGQPRQLTKTWGDPKRWNDRHAAFYAEHGRRQRVFCASLADVFDNEVPEDWRRDLFRLIEATPNLDWLLLTKRIGNARAMSQAAMGMIGVIHKPMPTNVWLGATVVNQAEADRDIPKLLQVPARVRFLSVEPMLGPMDLGAWIGDEDCHVCGARFYGDEHRCGGAVRAVEFEAEPEDEENIRRVCPVCQVVDTSGEVGPVENEDRGGGLHWVICGGESGPGARPMHPDWGRSLRDQCQAAGVPFLFKQWGEWAPATQTDMGPPEHTFTTDQRCDIGGGRSLPFGVTVRRVGKKAAGRLLDDRTHDGFPEAR